jgi:hypothetical protein
MKEQHLLRHYYPGHVFIPKDGYFQVRKIGLTGDRVKTDPRFHKTRSLAHTFAAIAQCSRLMRTALCICANIPGDAPRFLQLLHQALEGKKITTPASINWSQVNLDALQGFNLNRKAPFNEICKVEPGIMIDPATAQATVSWPSFVPAHYIQGPAGITHCRLYMITASIDMVQASYTCTINQSSLLPLKKIHIPPRKFISAKAQKNTLTLVAIGISWYAKQEAKGKVLPAKTPGSLMMISAG